jgi:RNA polymerase sigma-70 factor, ECF subfamily
MCKTHGRTVYSVRGKNKWNKTVTSIVFIAQPCSPYLTRHMSALAPHLTLLLPKLWRFALRLTRHQQDAEDLVQRTCVRALERQQQWNPEGSALSWLYAIMHSIWLNEMRSRRLYPVSSLTGDDGDVMELGAAVEGVASDLAEPESLVFCRQIVAAVDELPEAQRLVMLLIAVDGMSYAEAAEVLNVPVGTVMSRIFRARVSIGERLSGAAKTRRIHVA